MKITKAQKEAIVNEIGRRLTKEEKSFTENFNKNYKFTKEEKEFLDLCKETEELHQKWETLEDKNKDFARKLGFTTYSYFTESCARNRILSKRLRENHTPKSVDFSEIRDRLEFATLDPSFDVEEFVKKYI